MGVQLFKKQTKYGQMRFHEVTKILHTETDTQQSENRACKIEYLITVHVIGLLSIICKNEPN